MSDENVGGLVASISAIETPEIGLHKLLVQRGADLSDLDRARVKRAIDALSAHGQPVVDAELMKRVLGAPYDGVTVGDFFVYADFSEHDTLGVVRAIVAAALGDTP